MKTVINFFRNVRNRAPARTVSAVPYYPSFTGGFGAAGNPSGIQASSRGLTATTDKSGSLGMSGESKLWGPGDLSWGSHSISSPERTNVSVGLALSLVLFCSISAQPIKLIEELDITKNRIDVKINLDFKKAYLKDDFFVEYNDESIDLTRLDYAVTTLPFIMNVISLVWISGKEYYVDSMDEEVYESLERIKKLYKFFYPQTAWNGKLIPKKMVRIPQLVNKEGNSQKVALLFSGGVDSVSASFAHRDKQQLLITAWGQSCLPLDQEDLWLTIKNHVTDFAQQYGHENSFMKSNYYYFLNFKKLCKLSPEIITWRIDTIEDMGWTGLTAPLLLSKGIPTLLIASSDTWDFFYPSATNPFITGNIRFAGLNFKLDQFDMTRFDKIATIHNLCKHHLVEKPEFIICQQKGGVINCGTCEKCCCTLLSLLALGARPEDYGFDISPEAALKQAKKCLTPDEIGCFLIWQCIDLQKKNDLSKKKPYDLSWLGAIDFSKKKANDLKDIPPVDLEAIHKLFPYIKIPGMAQPVREHEKITLEDELEPVDSDNTNKSLIALALAKQAQQEAKVEGTIEPQPEYQFVEHTVQNKLEVTTQPATVTEVPVAVETPTVWQRVKSWFAWLVSWYEKPALAD